MAEAVDPLANLTTTLSAVVSIFVALGIGVVAVYKKVLTRQGVSQLAELVRCVFSPLMMFTRLGANLSASVLASTWSLPLVLLGLLFVNLLVSYLFTRVVKTPKWFRDWFVVGTAFSNVMALPLMFLASICDLVEFPALESFDLSHAHQDGSSLHCNATNGNATYSGERDLSAVQESNGGVYLMDPPECRSAGEFVLFTATILHSFYLWTFVYDHFRKRALRESHKQHIAEPGDVAAAESAQVYGLPDRGTSDGQGGFGEESSICHPAEENMLRESFQIELDGAPGPEGAQARGDDGGGGDDAEGGTDEGYARWLRKCISTVVAAALPVWSNFVSIMQNPPNFAQVLGIFVGLIPVLQWFVFDPSSVFYPVTSSLRTIAVGLVPSLNLIVAGSLGLKLCSMPSLRGIFHSLEVPRSTVFWFVFMRMILLPAINFATLYFVQGWLNGNKLTLLLFLFTACTPTNNAIVLMAASTGDTRAADTLSIAIMFQYFVGIFTMTAFTFLAFSML